MRVPVGVNALLDLPAEHQHRDPRTADELKAGRMQGIVDCFGVRCRHMVGVSAPIVPGQYKNCVGPAACLDDRVDSLPLQVLALGHILQIRSLIRRMLVITRRTPHE